MFDLSETLSHTADVLNDVIDQIKIEEESYWNSLSKEDQLSAFNCICRRLSKGKLEESRSYRGILYDIFGFGVDSYIRAQAAGFIDIHNSIMTADQEAQTMKSFAKYLGVEVSDQIIDEFIWRKYL